MKKPLLTEMTLREKIGQMLLPYQYDVYYEDTGTYPDNMRSEQELKDYIAKEQFGTYYHEQTAIHKLQQPDLTEAGTSVVSAPYKDFVKKQSDLGKIPALFAGDWETEGPGHVISDLSVTCRTPAIGAADSEELAYELARNIAKELRTAGANWRWAPTVDIGGRYISTVMRVPCVDDVDRMITLLKAQIKGTQDEGVAATAKHFPGGGSRENTYKDSHFCPHYNSLSMEEWWKEQGRIFQELIDAGVYSIMTGHQGFPAVDDSKLKGKYRPATVSKKIVTDLLKGEMGFEGVVVTDGICMAGLAGCFETYEELIIELVNAGNDVILGSLPESGDIIEKAIADAAASPDKKHGMYDPSTSLGA